MNEQNAFPSSRPNSSFSSGPPEHDSGMTLRQYAAIKLKVPRSGTPWLDEMIEESRREELADRITQAWETRTDLEVSTKEKASVLFHRVKTFLKAER
jgi:hypothetical protein